MNKTILISGASGLLGNELVNQLLNTTSYNVVALTSQRKKLKKQYRDERLTVLHVENWEYNIDSKLKIDTFINCAFPRSSDPEQLAQGLVFTEKIVKKATRLNTKSIINISSQSVYSQKEKEITNESLTVAPESLYGMTKYASERIVKSICESSKKKVFYSNIRLASLTGLNFDVRMTNRFVKSALTNQPITINGGEQQISYLEVRDAASALIKMLNSDLNLWYPIYNLGNKDSFSLLELVETIQVKAKKHSIHDVKLEVKDIDNSFNNLMNSELFYKDFNWQPRYNMPEMIQELFEYYKLKLTSEKVKSDN